MTCTAWPSSFAVASASAEYRCRLARRVAALGWQEMAHLLPANPSAMLHPEATATAKCCCRF